MLSLGIIAYITKTEVTLNRRDYCARPNHTFIYVLDNKRDVLILCESSAIVLNKRLNTATNVE